MIRTVGRFESEAEELRYEQTQRAAAEARISVLSKPERVAFLLDHGWHQVRSAGSQTWFAPGWRRVNPYLVEPSEHDRASYTLAAAIRRALAKESS